MPGAVALRSDSFKGRYEEQSRSTEGRGNKAVRLGEDEGTVLMSDASGGPFANNIAVGAGAKATRPFLKKGSRVEPTALQKNRGRRGHAWSNAPPDDLVRSRGSMYRGIYVA